jgi:hypothetical protein
LPGHPDDPFCFAENSENLYLILTNLVSLDTPCCPEFQVIISRKFVNNILEFQGCLQPEEFLDLVAVVEEVLDFKKCLMIEEFFWWQPNFGKKTTAWRQQWKQS